MPYIRNEDPSFQNLVIDIVKNRYDLKIFFLGMSDYGRNIQKNINATVADEKFIQSVVCGALDEKNKGVFESAILLRLTFKDAKKIGTQCPVIENLLRQANTNKINGAKVIQLLGQAEND